MRRVLPLVFGLSLMFASPCVSGQEPSGDALDQAAYWILKKKCARCHDDLGDQARLPKPKYDDIEWNGPLTPAEKSTIRKWINRGGVSEEFVPRDSFEPRQLTMIREMIERIARDLQQRSGAEVDNGRYLTLTHLHNRSDITEEELEIYRAAIVCKRPLPLRNITSERLTAEVQPSLGRVKGFDVLRKQRPQDQQSPDSQDILSAPLTGQKIDVIFSQNEWATASVSVVIRPD